MWPSSWKFSIIPCPTIHHSVIYSERIKIITVNTPVCVSKTWRSSTRWQELGVRWSARRPTRTEHRQTCPCTSWAPCRRIRPWSWLRSPTTILRVCSWSRSADWPAVGDDRRSVLYALYLVSRYRNSDLVILLFSRRLPAIVRRSTPGWRKRRFPTPRRTRAEWAPLRTPWMCVWVFSARASVWWVWTTSGCEWSRKILEFRCCRNGGPECSAAWCPCRSWA